MTVHHATEAAARAAVIDVSRRLIPLALTQGTSGNVSCRWARDGRDGMLITPSGRPYDTLVPEDLAWVPLAQPAPAVDAPPLAPPVGAEGPHVASSEWRMHRDVYVARAEAQAVVHAHPPFGTTLACLPRVQREGIPPFHYMIAVAGGDDIKCAAYATFGTQALSTTALAALEGRTACLLAHHGLLTLGPSLEAALAVAVEVEVLARCYWQALQVGEPGLLDADEMARVQASFARYRATAG